MANIQRTLTEDYYWAYQYQDKTVQAYAARLDELVEDIKMVLNKEDHAEKFWVDLCYAIKAKINKQASQATTYHDFIAQAQRIEAHKWGYKSNN